MNKFKEKDKVKVLKLGENGNYQEIGRGIVNRIANDNWIYYTDRDNSNQTIEELIAVDSPLTKVIKW